MELTDLWLSLPLPWAVSFPCAGASVAILIAFELPVGLSFREDFLAWGWSGDTIFVLPLAGKIGRGGLGGVSRTTDSYLG